MGLTHVRATVVNPANPRRSARLTFLVDSGAIYSVVPATTLRRLGIRPRGTRTFTLADGTEIRRRLGDAIFVVDGDRAASPVIFGERGDSILLGTVSLGSLGFVLDPIKRVLRPLPMVLGSHSAPLIGRLKSEIRARGNILSTGLRWNARPRRAPSASRQPVR